MNKKTSITAFVFLILGLAFFSISIYLSNFKSISSESLKKKLSFVSLVNLPDLAISTEATYIRHRSISSVFEIYKDDGSLREYFPSTYVYNSSVKNNIKSYNEK